MEQREAGNAYSVLEHVDVLMFVEAGLFGDCLEKWYNIAVIIPN